MTRPEIVTLCGSTRFKAEILTEMARITMLGKIVIPLGVFGHIDMPDIDWSTDGSELKTMLDELHFEKIKLSDSIHVVNVGGYVGESTAREVEFARSLIKKVTYMVQPKVAK